MMSVDAVLSDVYSDGRYHQLLIVLYAMNVVSFQFSLHFYAFLLYKPQGIKCLNAHKILQNNSTEHYFQVAPPMGKNITDQCLWREGKALRKCYEWEYPHHYVKSNLVTQENLLCNRAFLRPTLESVYLMGIVLGHIFVLLTARFSRRTVFLFLLTCQCMGNIILIFTEHLSLMGMIMFTRCFTRCINALCYTQIIELMPIEKRAKFGNMFYLSVGVGITLFSITAYFARDWQSIKLLIPLFCLTFPVQVWLFPKSVRQLVMQKRAKETLGALTHIARFNSKPLDLRKLELDVTKLCTQGDEENPKGKESLLNAFRDNYMRTRVLLSTVYLGFSKLIKFSLVWHLTFQTEDIYLNFLISGVSEILGIILPLGLTERFGRRTLCLFFGLSTGVGIIATPWLGRMPWVKFGVGMATKVLIRSLISMTELASVELFPTSIRHAAFNFTLIYSSSLIVVAPFLRAVFSDDVALQMYAGCMMGVAVMFYTLMPETKGCPLPQVITDIYPNEFNLSERTEKSVDENGTLLSLYPLFKSQS